MGPLKEPVIAFSEIVAGKVQGPAGDPTVVPHTVFFDSDKPDCPDLVPLSQNSWGACALTVIPVMHGKDRIKLDMLFATLL